MAGGILFLDGEININDKNKFDIQEHNLTLHNNIGRSYGNKYASKPFQVVLHKGLSSNTVQSGGVILLSFKILDFFNSLVNDISGHFHDLSMTIQVIPDIPKENNEFYFQGNQGHFINGNDILQY